MKTVLFLGGIFIFLYSFFSEKRKVRDNAGKLFLVGVIAIVWGLNIEDKKKKNIPNPKTYRYSPAYQSSYTSDEDIGYEWAEENDITDFSDCQYEFGASDEEDGCNRYVRENQYGGTQYFDGYECTEDCSGHQAGYEWAEDNGITQKYDCDGYSDSFIEGCRIYVEENY